jgi:hypothetical protein
MFKRKFGMPLQSVEEREWRIVHHSGGRGFVLTASRALAKTTAWEARSRVSLECSVMRSF